MTIALIGERLRAIILCLKCESFKKADAKAQDNIKNAHHVATEKEGFQLTVLK